jgi:quinol monooxygenase YgiN
MVMTILEAAVDRENWQNLKDTFGKEVQKLDPGLVQTYLVQAKKDENIWRIITIWESQEALDRMRQSGETPRGVLMFRSAEAEPTLTIFNILAQSS